MNTSQIYQEVTNRILAEMEKGIIPWLKPWTCTGGAVSHTSGRPYSLLNQILIMLDGGENDVHYGEYLTFKQAKAEGGMVRKGEKGRFIVFWKMYSKEEEKDGEKTLNVIPVLRSYYVFEVSQCDGIKRKYEPEKHPTLSPVAEAEDVVAKYFDREACGLRISESDRAYYSPVLDLVNVPQMSQYDAVEQYYGTLFHEITHSTGHKTRLDRFMDGSTFFGSEVYSKEELVAEMGSAFMLNRLGIESKKAFRNSVAYLQGWSSKLRKDSKLFVNAASKAEAAVNYIINGKEETK